MSSAAFASKPFIYDTVKFSPAARRIIRRSTSTWCPTGKRGYRTVRKARVALAALQRDELRRQTALGQQDRVERRPYSCDCCGLFHLTSRA